MQLAPGWRPWVIAPALASLPAFFLWRPAGLGLVGLGLFVLWFFRDPDRPVGEAIVSAADGRIREVDGKVVTFLNLHHVHVVRAPFAGRVRKIQRLAGGRVPAFLKGAEKNGGVSILVATEWGDLRVDLKAGLIARRAIAYVDEGDDIAKGQRVGMIRFGSRVDVQLPEGAQPCVGLAERVWAGQTTIAEPHIASTGESACPVPASSPEDGR